MCFVVNDTLRRLWHLSLYCIFHASHTNHPNLFFFFQAEDGIRDHCVTGVQTCALPILPSEKLMSEMQKYHEELQKAGVLLDASGLKPSSKGWRVKYSGAKRTVIDGPFAEAKELKIGRASCRERV